MKIAAGLTLLALAGGAFAAKWKASGNDLVLTSGQLSVNVTPKLGRVSSMTWNGKSLLGDSGSLFYPAPQSDFPKTWPPPVGFTLERVGNQYDPPNFQFFLNADSTVLLARPTAVGALTTLLPSREYQFDAATNGLVVKYSIKNTSTSVTKSVAPWEVTRVPLASIVFFPKGQPVSVSSTYSPVKEDSLVWVNAPNNGSKIFRDGKEGWLAAINDSILFVKVFEDLQPKDFAPGETEIELYSGQGLFEMEEQGPYTTLKPGDSLTWSVRWFVRGVPASVATLGNHALVDSARALAKSSTASARPRHSAFIPNRRRPLVDIRGRLLPKSQRTIGSGSVGILPIR